MPARWSAAYQAFVLTCVQPRLPWVLNQCAYMALAAIDGPSIMATPFVELDACASQTVLRTEFSFIGVSR